MRWLLGMFGLCWKSEVDEMYRKYLSMEGMAARLELDVARLTANRDSLEATCKVLRSDNAMLRDQVAYLELDDEDEDFDDDFDDDDDDWDDEDYEDEDDDE